MDIKIGGNEDQIEEKNIHWGTTHFGMAKDGGNDQSIAEKANERNCRENETKKGANPRRKHFGMNLGLKLLFY